MSTPVSAEPASAEPPSALEQQVRQLLAEREAWEREQQRLVAEQQRLVQERDKALTERDAEKQRAAWLFLQLERLRYGEKTPREKVDPRQIQLVFEPWFQAVFDDASSPPPAQPPAAPPGQGKTKTRTVTAHGRRDLGAASLAHLPVETVVLSPAPVPEGAVQVATDVSYRLGFRRAGYVRIRLLRPVFAVTEEQAQTANGTAATLFDPEGKPSAAACDVEQTAEERDAQARAHEALADRFSHDPSATAKDNRGNWPEVNAILTRTLLLAPAPSEVLPRGLPSPELLAHILYSKFALHLPFHRLETMTAEQGVPITRGTMCGWTSAAHELAKYVVEAMERDARERAKVILTDATGVLVQGKEKCRKGHVWIYIADRDHVILRYSASHSSEEPKAFFQSYAGVVLSDASSVFNALYRSEESPDEANCWSHGRRYFYKAIDSEHPKEALFAIGVCNKLFEWEQLWKKDPPEKRLAKRQQWASPMLERMKTWLDEQVRRPDVAPGSRLRKALNYVDNQWAGLTYFLQDGRVPIHNNDSERGLRHVAVGRNNWMFVYSDDTAPWLSVFVSLIASCRLHGLDTEGYLRDLMRVLPHWPKTRMLELSPLHWKATRARLDEAELRLPLGPLKIPPATAG